MRTGGAYRQISPRGRERQWIEEARQFRLARLRTEQDLIRFDHDFGPREDDRPSVLALRRNAWEKAELSSEGSSRNVDSVAHA